MLLGLEKCSSLGLFAQSSDFLLKGLEGQAKFGKHGPEQRKFIHSQVPSLPKELEEAAAIDGCGPIKVFYKVVLPLIKPGIAAASIFTFRIAWNEFILALGSLIAIPPLIFTFIAARQIITGLTAGAVKG
jgi:ABC-type glycerol-3-phosphate transport system permease component